MTDLEREYVGAYQEYLCALDELGIIKDNYQIAAMAYFQSLTRQIP